MARLHRLGQITKRNKIEILRTSEATREGATLLCGGSREKSLLHPIVLENVNPKSKIARREIFGPVTV